MIHSLLCVFLIYIYIYIYIYILNCYCYYYFYFYESFHPTQGLIRKSLDEVFTHMALKSHRSRSHVKASMVLIRADHLFIHNYI